MPTITDNSLRFIPGAVEGLPAVTEVAVFPDRMELLTDGRLLVVRFVDIARWDRRGWLYRLRARLGFGVRGQPMIGDRDLFHPSGRFFRFFTVPPITVFMPDEGPETKYWGSLFRRLQDVIATGGFSTSDLG